jgi:hypothetical protein
MRRKLNNVNLKWLLGIKVAQNNNKGILMFRKKSENKNYYLHYASEEMEILCKPSFEIY